MCGSRRARSPLMRHSFGSDKGEPMRMPSPLATTLLIVASGIVYLQVRSYQDAHPLEEDATAPSFALPLLAAPHETVGLAKYRGHVLIIEAWARSCANCRSSMPALETLADAYRGRGLEVLHVALEEMADSSQVRTFLADVGVTGIDVAMDQGGEFRRSYVVTGIPTSYVIDKRGDLRWQGTSTGYDVAHVLTRPAGRKLLDELVME